MNAMGLLINVSELKMNKNNSSIFNLLATVTFIDIHLLASYFINSDFSQ